MQTYIELFKAKDAWLQLSAAQRAEYMQQVGSSMQAVLGGGGELVAVGSTDAATRHHVGYDFFAIWQLPDSDAVRVFEKGIEADDWYDYFEQVNASGKVGDFGSVAQTLIDL